LEAAACVFESVFSPGEPLPKMGCFPAAAGAFSASPEQGVTGGKDVEFTLMGIHPPNKRKKAGLGPPLLQQVLIATA
jgi:hypothetical protein